MGNLDLIVHMYNNVEATLLPVERPLLQQELVRESTGGSIGDYQQSTRTLLITDRGDKCGVDRKPQTEECITLVI